MQVLIVCVAGDPKYMELRDRALDAGYTVITADHKEEAEAKKEAAKLAGRGVRLPFFFVGEKTVKGTYPRERAGGADWFAKRLSAEEAAQSKDPEPEKPTVEGDQAAVEAATRDEIAKLKKDYRHERGVNKSHRETIKGQGDRIAELEQQLEDTRKVGESMGKSAGHKHHILVLTETDCERVNDRLMEAAQELRVPYREINGFAIEHALHEVESAVHIINRIRGRAGQELTPPDRFAEGQAADAAE